jgi:phenylacetate-coenzyme A ligase PaaK-like adenylate-forming protein
MNWTEVQLLAKTDFNLAAMSVFKYQYAENEVYRSFCKYLGKSIENVSSFEEIPFLPIETWKYRNVKTGNWTEEVVFTSSGTTGQIPSKHFIRNESEYHQICLTLFVNQFGSIENTSIFSLLPSYLEREGSGLISMMDYLMKHSGNPRGFFLDQISLLQENIQEARKKGNRIILLGVTFALLSLVEQCSLTLEPQDIIIETGGMKGRRKEITREELHEILKKGFGVSEIYSEYGMTELMSQGYFQPKINRFTPAPWMKVLTRDPFAPTQLLPIGQTGALQIIDLGNLHSCSFLASGDVGTVYEDGSFEVKGRIDQAEMRGCNLMVL